MSVYIVKVLNDIQNNYQGVDDIEIYVYDKKVKALMCLMNRALGAINFMVENCHCSIDDLDIIQEDNLFHVNDQNNYITIKIEEKEVQ